MIQRGVSGKSAGFTLVELLVVVTIIGLLIALLLPAVQGAREAARRAQCNNNAKQLGLACMNYESQYQYFPPSSNSLASTDPGNSRVHYRNWVISVLPFLEQQALYDAFDFSAPISHSNNRAARGTDLPMMKCPSDRGHNVKFASANTTEGDNWARGNYGANASLSFHQVLDNYSGALTTTPCSYSRWHRGVMGSNLSMGVSEIFDGTSNTILLGELRVGLVDIDRRGTWALGGPASSALWGHAWGTQNGPNSCTDNGDDILDCSELTTKAGGLATTRAECMTCQAVATHAGTLRSRHPGGVHVTMADGSVHWISNYIEKGTGLYWSNSDTPSLTTQFLCWQRLCTSQDGQVVDGAKY